ncbi:hypothetical protein AX16_006064 [Volvariella volvacea WC 439]|nr:hypothetical protein AX16_006064 [Volvariella volvacea WC 439]
MLLGTLFVFLLSRTLAHPLSPPAVNPAPPTSPVLNAFVAISDCIRDPSRVRSTSELLWNCIGTIFVCTYVAIHPNMPDRNATRGTEMWQKVKTCLYALLAPEVVILLAMQQRCAASRIARRYRYGDGDVELGGETEKRGVIFPTISEDEIRDKAKGDFLSKLVVIMQTSWFVIQCIARHAQGLVVTELELVTLAFATLNVIMYFLWWSKPLNAEYPIYFKKDGSRTSGPVQVARESLGLSEMYSGLWVGWTWRRETLKKGIWNRIKDDMDCTSPIGMIWKWLIKKPFGVVFNPLLDMMVDARVTNPTCVGPYYNGSLPDAEHFTMISLSSLIGVLFGEIHLIGWNFQFSTHLECYLWRTSSLIVTVEPAILAIGIILDQLKDGYPRFESLITIAIVPLAILAGFVGPIAYVLARISLLVLPLFALRDLPPSAHQNVQWSDYLPHI